MPARRLLISLIAMLAIGAVAPASASAAELISVSPGYIPAFNADAPDPDVVLVGSTYYGYTTGTGWGNHIGVLKSSSVQSGWAAATSNAGGSSAFAIDAAHVPAAWQVNSTQVAPGVFSRSGRWIMYYAAQAKKTHRWCLSIATATTPAGPFTDRSGSKPWFCIDAAGGVTDPHPFIDVDGRPWLYFKTNTGAVVEPARLWAVQLSADGMKMVSFPKVLLTQLTGVYPWETTIENPQMFVRNGVHYLLFSGNQWDSPNYAEGYAVCATASGPCSRPLPIPFLMRYGTVLGPGGASVVADLSGRMQLAYHAWRAPCTSYSCGGQRRLYVTPLKFGGHELACVPPSKLTGYRMVATDGGVFAFGASPYCGSTGGITLARTAVAMASTPNRGGYWIVTAAGAVYAFGNARFLGVPGAAAGNTAISIASAPDGKGYWIATANGGVFAYGSAHYYGSRSGNVSARIVAMAGAPDGNGYWLAGADGAVYPFGSAHGYGSMAGKRLNRPIVGMAATPDGHGYWLVATDGGIFALRRRRSSTGRPAACG